ncbi:MAG: replication-associated recombination protein A [Coriobacteriia bacterium]|nr:replication-associated recombination protein A [Coriobacteriia bacterium]
MEDLFFENEQKNIDAVATLAGRMRPQTLDDIVGQEHVIGKDTWLYNAIQNDTLSSIILFGPAGTGKTSIAHVVANTTNSHFVEVSAVGGTVKDLRREIARAEELLRQYEKRTILFVDEIHRFNRSQQDALLHAVEDNVVTLIGATTENPYFEVNSALNSRSHIIQLNVLSDDNIKELLNRAMKDKRGLNKRYKIEDDALDSIVLLAGGDGRGALNILELAAGLSTDNKITSADVKKAIPNRAIPYDKNQDMHYDIISAFIKSMRGGDPDAAVYWMARMLEGGEDPKFIARRIYILASEDIGNADPQAICVAQAAFKAVEVIGLPECKINLAQAAIYMALAPKSNAVVEAIGKAVAEVKHGPVRYVPNNLRDRHRPGSEEYGEYKYPHNYPGGWVDQQYLPDGLEPGCFYKPSERGWEAYRIDTISRDRH